MPERRCGSCTACCTMTPVAEIAKPAGVRCAHCKRGKGCMIYATRPDSCRAWSCLWLTDPATEALSRPDRSGYVLDCLPDFITSRNELTGAETRFEVVQVWASDRGVELGSDLLVYLESRHVGAVVRSATEGAAVLLPPWISPTGQWALTKGQSEGREHSREEVDAVLGLTQRV